jgi:SRSO17 transposase
MNLDGETNLKLKRSHPRTYKSLNSTPGCEKKQKSTNKQKKEEEMTETIENDEKMLDIEQNLAYFLGLWKGKIETELPSRSLTDV